MQENECPRALSGTAVPPMPECGTCHMKQHLRGEQVLENGLEIYGWAGDRHWASTADSLDARRRERQARDSRDARDNDMDDSP